MFQTSPIAFLVALANLPVLASLPPSPQNTVDLQVGRTDLNLCGPNLLERRQKYFIIQHCSGGRGGSGEKMCRNLQSFPTILAEIVVLELSPSGNPQC